MNSPDPIPLGKYRGFETELLFNTTERSYEERIKGVTSKNITLGDDAHGNITRIDNGIEKFAESLTFLYTGNDGVPVNGFDLFVAVVDSNKHNINSLRCLYLPYTF
jgi:hypothetical protein